MSQSSPSTEPSKPRSSYNPKLREGIQIVVIALCIAVGAWALNRSSAPPVSMEAAILNIVENRGAIRTIEPAAGEGTSQLLKNFVSIAQIGDTRYLAIADYSHLYCLDTESNKLMTISPPSTLANAGNFINWMPTGLFYSVHLKNLYIANYLGNDILEGNLDCAGGTFHLVSKIASPDTSGPENVAVSADGSELVSANYNDGSLTAFRRKGERWSRSWTTKLQQAHAVAILSDNVYGTSLSERSLVKLNLATGTPIAKASAFGPKASTGQMMWPTSLASYKRQIILSDAHTGYFCGLDPDTLKFLWCAGGYGLGLDRFNMPYGVGVFDDDLVIASAFSSRVTEVRPNLAEGNAQVIRDWFWTGGRPLNPDYMAVKGYQREAQTISYDPYTLPCKLPKWLHNYTCRYGGLVRHDEQKMLLFPSASSTSQADGYFYFIDALKTSENDVMLFASPQESAVLYLGFKNDVPVVLDYRLELPGFVRGDEVISAIATTSVAAIEQHLSVELDQIDRKRTTQGIVLANDAAIALMGSNNASAFPARLANVYTSEAGQRFVALYLTCSRESCEADKLRGLAMNIAKAELGEEHVNLDKLMVACMLTNAPCGSILRAGVNN